MAETVVDSSITTLGIRHSCYGPRPLDWGQRDTHPLYELWKTLRPRYKQIVCDRWGDFWEFVDDVGERPTDRHMLCRHDALLTFDKNNCFWRAPRAPEINTGDAEGKRAYQREYMRDWYGRNPVYSKDKKLQRKHGITLADYNKMLADQNGVCAICKRPETAIDKRSGKPYVLAVDHCHRSNQIRGLLCTGCNTSIGLFRDDPNIIRAAAAYLERHADDSSGVTRIAA